MLKVAGGLTIEHPLTLPLIDTVVSSSLFLIFVGQYKNVGVNVLICLDRLTVLYMIGLLHAHYMHWKLFIIVLIFFLLNKK